LHNTGNTPSTRTPSRPPLFQGTRELKFTQEEIAAIRATEGAVGFPRPRRHRAPAAPPINLANLLALLFPGLGEALDGAAHALDGFVRVVLWTLGAAMLAAVVIPLASRSRNDSQVQAPSAESAPQYTGAGNNAPTGPPLASSEVVSLDSAKIQELPIPAPRLLVPETELATESATEAAPQSEAIPTLAAGSGTPVQPLPRATETATANSPGNFHRVPVAMPTPFVAELEPPAPTLTALTPQGENATRAAGEPESQDEIGAEPPGHTGKMSEVRARMGSRAEAAQSPRERRQTEVEAEREVPPFERRWNRFACTCQDRVRVPSFPPRRAPSIQRGRMFRPGIRLFPTVPFPVSPGPRMYVRPRLCRARNGMQFFGVRAVKPMSSVGTRANREVFPRRPALRTERR